MAFDLKKSLKKAKGLWEGAKEKVKQGAGAFAEYEDGRYLARCVDLSLGESAGGRFQADMSWRFEEGEYEGQLKHSYQGLDTEDGWRFFGSDLRRLGFEVPEEMTEEVITAIMADIAKTKPLCRVVLKTKGEFQNLYINKLLSGGSDEEEEMSGEDESDAETTEEEPAEEETTEEEAAEETPEEEEEETPEEEGDEVSLVVGMRVVANTSKGEVNGEVIEILEEEGKVRVKTDEGKVVRVTVDKIEILADEAPEEPPAPAPKKAAPKAAPKPAPKPAPAPAKPVAKTVTRKK